MSNIRQKSIFGISIGRILIWMCHPIALILVTLAGFGFLRNMENQWLSIPFAVSCVLLIAALLFAISNRIAFSVYGAWAFIGVLTIVSAAKYKLKGFSLHFYDLVFFARDLDVVRFLASSYLHIVALVAVLTAVVLTACIIIYKSDRRSSMRRRNRIAAVPMSILALVATFPSEAAVEQRYFYYLQGRHATAFFVSFLDLDYVIGGSSELDRQLADAPRGEAFANSVQCGSGPRPDVFVVLEESHIDLNILPELAAGVPDFNEVYRQEGRLAPLNVEVFGGGSWISNLSLMTGLSATDFGWRSPYLTLEMEGRIKGALPEVFARCGYRSVAVIPFEYNFVNEGPFLNSIGFENVYDIKAIEAPHYHMRDSFYFTAIDKIVEEHRAKDDRPLFVFVETMLPHSPYNEKLATEVELAGEPFHADPEVAEYLRRMMIARKDFNAFAERRRAASSERGTVVLTYGDHQSFVTKPFVENIDGPGALGRTDSLAYRTFYTISSTNPTAPGERQDRAIDIAFLGPKLLEAAGIPGSPMFQDLAVLERVCHGAFNGCALREEIDRHLRRRIDGGLLDLETGPASKADEDLLISRR